MPKIVDHDNRKECILLSAGYAFAEHGYHSTRMSHIADKAGVSRTTIYQYYNDKDEIFHAAMAMALSAKDKKYTELVSDEAVSPVTRLKALTDALLEDCFRETSLFSLILDYISRLHQENPDKAAEMKDYLGGLQNLFASLLQQGYEKGEIRECDFSSMGLIFFSLTESFVFQSAVFQDKGYEHIRSAVHVLIDGLCS